jgi:hypothetical protein
MDRKDAAVGSAANIGAFRCADAGFGKAALSASDASPEANLQVDTRVVEADFVVTTPCRPSRPVARNARRNGSVPTATRRLRRQASLLERHG